MLELTNLIGFGGAGLSGGAPAEGDFFAWGNNSNGQGANGGTPNPILVPTNTDMTAGIVIRSNSFNYAQHMTYLIGDVLSTVGKNQYGQLGLNDTNDRDVFVVVSFNGSNITDVACGGDHTLVIRNDKVNGCGRNQNDQLTDSEPSQISTFAIIVDRNDIGGGDPVRVFASRYTSAVLTSNSEVYTWGTQIGAGSDSTNPEPINIADLPKLTPNLDGKIITDFAMGTRHALALTDEGFVYSMAERNPYGQAGNGSVTNNSEKTELVFDSGLVTKVACGVVSSYLISDGVLFGCGNGSSGELGAATTSSAVSTFIDIGGGITDWIDVQSGNGYVIAQRQDGTLYHSGKNNDAQQGNGDDGGDEFGFVQIVGGTTAKVYTSYVAANSTIYGLS